MHVFREEEDVEKKRPAVQARKYRRQYHKVVAIRR